MLATFKFLSYFGLILSSVTDVSNSKDRAPTSVEHAPFYP